MKAFLMHRDRDFDPERLLARRDKELGRRYYDQKEWDLRELLPWNEAALRQDLGLDILLRAMSAGDKFLFEVARVALLSSVRDPDTIRYRQDVFSDCIENEAVVREIHRIAIGAIEEERKNYFASFLRYPSGILRRSVEVMEMFTGLLKRLRKLVDRHAAGFASEGFTRLFAMLADELTDGYFAEIDDHLARLRFRRGVLVSAELGSGTKGANYVLRRPRDGNGHWITQLLGPKPPSYTFHLHPRDEAGARALSELNDKGLNLAANALARSADHILSFFQMLRTELSFYVGCLNLHAELARLGVPSCLPGPQPAGSRRLSCSGLADASLALSAERNVVGNELAADDKSLCIITGANTGGKSTFLRSMGVAQLMMQAGMIVAADSFSSEVCNGIFTHYKREEDARMESGKWDEELGRMSAIVDRIAPQSLVLFNESFASTNEREGSEIAHQIVTALLERQVKVFFVTHLYHFAHAFAARDLPAAIFLRAERRPDGTRPFKLIQGEPLQTSYGEDLYGQIFGEGGATSPADRQERTTRKPSALVDPATRVLHPPPRRRISPQSPAH